jgi:regulator of protease activity HflC (stomatin/prohibitin superfamily)
MGVVIAVAVIVVLLALLGFGLSVRIVRQYEQGVLFRLGRLRGPRAPGFNLIIPGVDVLRRVSLRVVTMPIQSQGIITRDNVSVDVPAVAYYKVADAVKSVVAIENVRDAIGQIAQTTLRRSSASTPWTRSCRKPTRSTRTSARASRSPRPTGGWR